MTDFLSPILLASDPFGIGTTSGGVATPAPNPIKLINPNRSAMLIDEFRLTNGSPLPGEDATVMLKLTYGSTPLTNDFLPFRSFMPNYLIGQSNDAEDSSGVWHLARPLYVPPDVQVGVEVQRRIPPGFEPDDDNEKWCFVIAGRSMPTGMTVPNKIFVPWACAAVGFLSDEVLSYQSNDGDIGNPFDTPLNIDYLTGYATERTGNTNRYDPTFQATLSNGKVLARDPTPLTAVFPVNRPMMRMRAVLQPKEFISVAFNLPLGAEGSSLETSIVMGMTGWRELQTPRGARP